MSNYVHIYPNISNIYPCVYIYIYIFFHVHVYVHPYIYKHIAQKDIFSELGKIDYNVGNCFRMVLKCIWCGDQWFIMVRHQHNT